jgi:hypothetical protein
MSLSIVYDLGSYDHVIEEGVPNQALAQAIVTNIQPFHDKPLQVKEPEQVRIAMFHEAKNLLCGMSIETPEKS